MTDQMSAEFGEKDSKYFVELADACQEETVRELGKICLYFARERRARPSFG